MRDSSEADTLPGRITLIIIDDEYHIREGISNLPWDEIGIRFLGSAGSSADGLSLVEQQNPDIVLTDIRMPGIDGIEFSRLIKAKNDKVHIIMLTGYHKFDYAREAIRIGVDEFLLKPTDPDELFSAVSTVRDKIVERRIQRQRDRRLAGVVAEAKALLEEHDLADQLTSRLQEIDREHRYLGSNPAVLQVVELLEKEFDRELSLLYVADQVCLNPDYLGRVLKKETGKTFSELLQQERMREAARLLLAGSATIPEIAECCGFKDSAYFSRLFRRYYHLTPGEFRKQ